MARIRSGFSHRHDPPDCTESLNKVTRNLATDFSAGLALFLAVSYVVTANPEILSQAGIEPGAALLGTFIVVIAGTVVTSLVSGNGLVIAPAVGISIFFLEFHSSTGLTWNWLMVGCLMAGIAVLLAAIFDWRSRIIRAIPDSVKLGLGAALATLFVKNGLQIFSSIDASLIAENTKHLIGLLGVLAMSGIWIARWAVLKPDRPRSTLLTLVLSSEVFFCVGAITLYVHFFEPAYTAQLPADTELGFLWLSHGALEFGNPAASIFQTLIFAVIVWFIIITDIPGTPHEVIPKSHALYDERSFRKGFVSDGVFAFLAPALGTSSTIYYGENNILKSFDSYSARVGLLCALFFVIAFALSVAAAVTDFDFHISRIITPVSVAPVIIYIGLIIYLDQRERGQAAVQRDIQNNAFGKSEATAYLVEFSPALIAIVLTWLDAFEYAFLLSIILAFFIEKYRGRSVRAAQGGEARPRTQNDAVFNMVFGFAILVLFVRLVLSATG